MKILDIITFCQL